VNNKVKITKKYLLQKKIKKKKIGSAL